MERGELKSKIDELNELSEKVKSNYRNFYRGVRLERFQTVDKETGESIGDRKVANYGDGEKMSSAIKLYEEWFAQAEVLIKNFYPERLEEFRDISSTIRKLLTLTRHPLPFDRRGLIHQTDSRFDIQIGRINSLSERKEVSELRFRKQVKENLALEEVERAERLFEDDLIRPAGVLAGVALERHLKTIMDEREETEADFDVDIGDAADELYEKGIFSNTVKKELIHYAGVRNDCAHSDHDIDEIQVEKMIESVNDFIRRR